MQSCLSALLWWFVAVPVLFFAFFALGPWFWVLVGFVLLFGWWGQRATRDTARRCPQCGSPLAEGRDRECGACCSRSW